MDKEKKKKVIIVASLVILLVIVMGATYAYFLARIDSGASTDVDIQAGTVDSLQFYISNPLVINATQENFGKGQTLPPASTTATAKLLAGTDSHPSYNYNVYIDMQENTMQYTTSDKKPELVLKVTDPSGNEVTSIPDLTYNETIKGYDITEVSGLIKIVENHNITTTSTTEAEIQNWKIEIELVNLDSNQVANAGSRLRAEVKIQLATIEKADLTVATTYNGERGVPSSVGPEARLNCRGNTSTYNNQYNRIEVSGISSGYTSCNLNYADRTTKEYLNNKIISLSGTTQGNGKVVNEKIQVIKDNPTYSIAEMNYTKSSGNDMTITDNKYISNDTEDSFSTEYKFTPKINGFYKVCYSIPSSASKRTSNGYKNQLKIKKMNDLSIMETIYSNINSGDVISGCYDYGYVTKKDYVNIETYYYDQNITFWFEKTTDYTVDNIGYRYEGHDPNNYIWFNNELWRVIGVLGKKSHGVEGEDLTKIMRYEPLNSLAWDKTNTNNWSTSSLKSILNGAYLNKEDGTDSDYCYGSSTIKANCDYRKVGIGDNFRNMIKNVTWYYGGSAPMSTTIEEMYKAERKTTDGITLSDTGYIGLMYGSDYGYATPESKCKRSVKLDLYDYGTGNCVEQNWIHEDRYEWTLSTYPRDNSKAIYIEPYGYLSLSNHSVSYGFQIRPVLYLDSNVYITGGDGTMANPYMIGM